MTAKDIMLCPRVIFKNFIPESFVKKDEVPLQIYLADYRNILHHGKGDLQLPKADLRAERGQRKVTQRIMSYPKKTKSELESAQVNVAVAKIAVDQADSLHHTTSQALLIHILSAEMPIQALRWHQAQRSWMILGSGQLLFKAICYYQILAAIIPGIKSTS